ncbi:MAG: pitrilysin family protein [Phycisphaerae bacterium]|jgi:predicted Zn-dependent peptidase
MLDKYVLKNGMVIIGEPLPNVESAAFEFSIPAGAALLPDGSCGAANIIEDWLFRGAGDYDSRQLSDALDSLGLNRSSSAGTSHISLAAAMESENLAKALELYASIINRPRLEDDQFIPAKKLALDQLAGLDDEPRTKVMLKLREQFFPQPLGRSTAGDADQLKSLDAQKVRQLVNNHFDLSQTIFSVAGKYDFDAVCGQMEKLFDAEKKSSASMPQITTGSCGQKYTHIHNDGAQVHIALMTPTVTIDDVNYYNMRVAVSILSGSMSARLFTEVREKRGLCYAIGAKYHGLKQAAGIACYAGTVPQTAQQTLDVIIEQFDKLKEGITDEEIARAKIGLESALIMSSESSAARAVGIADDYYLLGRVRTLDEIKQKIEQTTKKSVTRFLTAHPFEDYTAFTIGPEKIEI